MQTSESFIRLSGDDIIELVREHRDDFLRKLLHDDRLNHFLNFSFGVLEVSRVKKEFIKRALKELIAAPIDLVHYSPVILDMKRTGLLTLSTDFEKLLFLEVERSIRSYLL